MKAKEGHRKKSEQVSISLPAPMADWLKSEADKNMTSASAIIREALIPLYRKETEGEHRERPTSASPSKSTARRTTAREASPSRRATVAAH